MGSLSGLLHRPLSAVAAVAVAAVSSDFPDRFGYSGSFDPFLAERESTSELKSLEEQAMWKSGKSSSSSSSYTIAARVRGCKTEFDGSIRNSGIPFAQNQMLGSCRSTVGSVPALQTVYHYAKLAKSQESRDCPYPILSSSSDVLYRWSLPDPRTCNVASGKWKNGMEKSQTVVVLLGWLGARQRHLKRYADWYTSKGYHVVTFTFPMVEVLSYKVGGKAEQNAELLANHLADWVAEEEGKNFVFHTFSNTGWLTYGVILEKFHKKDPSLLEKIKGCIVDSAPVANPDPQVWASGFSAAFLKKQSIAAKGLDDPNCSERKPKPAASEVALLGILEKVFDVVLNLPAVNRRLSDVLDVLSTEQPKCPQLYIYSSSDRVIPAKAVESFIEQQRRAGHDVSACDFVSSPHVDHFRNHPNLYSSQLTNFLENHVLSKSSS